MDDPIPSIDGDVFGAFRDTAPQTPEAEAQDARLTKIKGLLGDDRWEAMQQVINDLIEQYKNVNLTDSDTVRSIGYKYLVSKRVVEVLEAIRDLPEKLDQI